MQTTLIIIIIIIIIIIQCCLYRGAAHHDGITVGPVVSLKLQCTIIICFDTSGQPRAIIFER